MYYFFVIYFSTYNYITDVNVKVAKKLLFLYYYYSYNTTLSTTNYIWYGNE